MVEYGVHDVVGCGEHVVQHVHDRLDQVHLYLLGRGSLPVAACGGHTAGVRLRMVYGECVVCRLMLLSRLFKYAMAVSTWSNRMFNGRSCLYI